MQLLAVRIERMARIDEHVGELSNNWTAQEKIAVCLVLDRGDWLLRMGLSMLAALEQLGPDWLAACQLVRREGFPGSYALGSTLLRNRK